MLINEFIFRVWDNKLNKIYPHCQLLEIAHNLGYYTDFQDVIIQRYTDKYDKNGNLICEGDIVKHKEYLSWDNTKYHEIISQVKFENCYFFLYNTTKPFLDLYGRDLTIIGNIFENNKLTE